MLNGAHTQSHCLGGTRWYQPSVVISQSLSPVLLLLPSALLGCYLCLLALLLMQHSLHGPLDSGRSKPTSPFFESAVQTPLLLLHPSSLHSVFFYPNTNPKRHLIDCHHTETITCTAGSPCPSSCESVGARGAGRFLLVSRWLRLCIFGIPWSPSKLINE